MRDDYIFISNNEWFECSSLKNPVCIMDYYMERFYPEFYSHNYDARFLATKPATAEELASSIYNDYRERYGCADISRIDDEIIKIKPKSVMLNGFQQEHFNHIAPKLSETVEVIYFYKCPKIKDLSLLSQFRRLKCVLLFWNNSLECLWDMNNNVQLKVISGSNISKLKDVSTLEGSALEYVHFDSLDNQGHRKKMLFDASVFSKMKNLKRLSLSFADCKVKY